MLRRSFRVKVFFGCLFLIVCQLFQTTNLQAKTEELVIGLEPEHNIFDQVARYRELTDFLSAELGIKVRLTIMSRYGEVLKRFQSRRLDGAFLNSFTASLAIKEFDLEPVARAVNLQGDATTRGLIFTRRDSGIKTSGDMKGKSIVFVDPSTTEGYLFPRSYFRQQGLLDLKTDFSRYFFSGSDASAIFAVLDGRADIGSAKDATFNRLTEKDSSIKSELSILAESPAFPDTTLCLRKDIPGELKSSLLSTLLQMNQTEKGKKILNKFTALRFELAAFSDFEEIMKMQKSLDTRMEKK